MQELRIRRHSDKKFYAGYGAWTSDMSSALVAKAQKEVQETSKDLKAEGISDIYVHTTMRK